MLSFITKFISGFQTQIMIGMSITIFALAAAGYWYYKDSQNTISILNKNIATLEANTTTLKNSIKQQNDSIVLLEKERVNDQKVVVDMAIRFGETQTEVDVLRKKLQRHDLKNLTRKKPGLIEKIINKASAKAFEEFEMISDPESYVPKKIIGEKLDEKTK